MTWEDAVNYGAALYDGCSGCGGDNGDCGLSDDSGAGDWRLPNVKELQSLIHYGVYDPAIPNTTGLGQWAQGDPFTNIRSLWYWTSTTYRYDDYFDGAWTVLMYTGGVEWYEKDAFNFVWPVRAGQ